MNEQSSQFDFAFDELDENVIAEILAAPTTMRRGRYTKDSTDDPLNRHILVWVRLPHSLSYCSNSTCSDQRPRRVTEGNAMCTQVGTHIVEHEDGTKETVPTMACRLCYLAGFNLPTSVSGSPS